MTNPKRWKIDVYEQGSRRDVMLRDEKYEQTIEIDNDGELRVEHEVESDSYGGGYRTVRAYFPMPKVIEFLREAGYEIREPGGSETAPSPDAAKGVK